MSAPGIGLRDEEVVVVDYNADWPASHAKVAAPLRERLPMARIDHIGSTSVPGLAAKPVIDINVGLAANTSLHVDVVEACGLAFRAVNPESVLFAIFDRPGFRLANVHVRHAGSGAERWDLLFRDFLRAHPSVAADYGRAKRRACEAVAGRGRGAYSETKAPFIASITPQIHRWALETRWEPQP